MCDVYCILFIFNLEFAHHICKILIGTLISEWHHKLKRKMILIVLSNIFIEHPFTYETARQENMLCFIISKLKTILLQITKQPTQKSVCIKDKNFNFISLNTCSNP